MGLDAWRAGAASAVLELLELQRASARELISTPVQASAASELSLFRASLLSQKHCWADLLSHPAKVEVSAEPRAALWCLLVWVGLGLGLRWSYGTLEVVGCGLGEGSCGQDGGSEEVTHCE